MIQLHSHCLVFETANGEHIPCAVEDVSVEVIGEAVEQLDHEIVKQAAAAVGQSHLMRAYEEAFRPCGQRVAQILLTQEDLRHRGRYLNARNTFFTLPR